MHRIPTVPEAVTADPQNGLVASTPPCGPILELAGRWRRFASLAYEAVLLVPVLFIAGWLYTAATAGFGAFWTRPLLQLWLLVVVGAYFVYCWHRGGQTLAMKTWAVRVGRADGSGMPVSLAVGRFALALASLLLCGIGFLWTFVDRDGQFLHDRLIGTRLFLVSRRQR